MGVRYTAAMVTLTHLLLCSPLSLIWRNVSITGFLTTKKHLQPDLEEIKEYPCYEDVYPNPSQHKESSDSDSDAIAAIHKAKIQWAMRIFAAKGYFLVLIGLSLNALWMYVLYMAKSNIQYNA